MNVKMIVARFGGNRPMARTLGIPESTVRGWVQAGVISTKHLPGVLAAGRDLDPPMTPGDFFDHEEKDYRLYELERDDRDKLLDTLREGFSALGVGEQLDWLKASGMGTPSDTAKPDSAARKKGFDGA